jgi:hypothetical protein
VFVPYGQADTYTPPITQFTYVVAANLGVAQPPASVSTPDPLNQAPQAIPLGGNMQNATITAVVREYTPSGYDGHFVVFKDDNAKTDANRFLSDALTGAIPHIGR